MTELAERAELLDTTTRFCRALRQAGVPVTPGEAIDATRTLALIDLSDRDELHLALRSVLVTRPEDYPIFDELFDEFWRAPAPRIPRPRIPNPQSRPRTPESRPPSPAHQKPAITLERWMHAADKGEEPLAIPRPSDREALGQQDFSTFSDEALREVTRVAKRMARRLAARPSRRWKPSARGTRVHLRRTVRQSLKTGGDLSELMFKERKLRKTKLVVLCDVSGSMDLYSRFFLQFLYALQNSFARVETFVFATRLSRVTEQLTDRRFRSALDNLAREVRDFSGGTRIGASLVAFNAQWPRLVDGRTIVILLSDGWDTGEPDQLAEALAVIHKRAGRVIWLNPLLGSPTYQPLTRGIQAALPHVDIFAPAHNLASLEALVRHLTL
jgi:uncharacterized protein